MRPSLVLACSLSLFALFPALFSFFVDRREREERACAGARGGASGQAEEGACRDSSGFGVRLALRPRRKKEKFEKKTAIFFLHLFFVISYLFSYLFLTPTFSQSQKTTRQKKTSARAQLVVSLFIYLSVYLSLFPRNGAQSLCVFMVKNSKKTKKNLIFCLSPFFSSFLKIPPMAASPPRPRGRLRRTSRHRH